MSEPQPLFHAMLATPMKVQRIQSFVKQMAAGLLLNPPAVQTVSVVAKLRDSLLSSHLIQHFFQHVPNSRSPMAVLPSAPQRTLLRMVKQPQPAVIVIVTN